MRPLLSLERRGGLDDGEPGIVIARDDTTPLDDDDKPLGCPAAAAELAGSALEMDVDADSGRSGAATTVEPRATSLSRR